jgi:hypothetical protein
MELLKFADSIDGDSQRSQTGVAVEKVAFLEKLPKFGDRKCPGDPRESFIARPNAVLFSRFSRDGVFQQPQALASTTPPGLPPRAGS